MRKSSKINFVIASLISLSTHAADLTTDKIEVISITPLPGIGVGLDKIPSNVQVVKGSDIQKSNSIDLSSYMNQKMTGVNINEMQGNPLQSDISYRGFTASPLLGTPQGLSVYMDGVRMNQPFGDVVSWDLIPKNAIYGMQLMPGSNPLFGLNTLGGAISVQTKDGRNSRGGAIQQTLGSYARKITEFEYGGVSSDNSIDYFVAGTYFDENGWRQKSESDNKQFFGKLGWQGEKTDLKLTYAYSNSDLNGNGLTPSTSLDRNRSSVYTYPDNTKNKSHFMNLTGSHQLSKDTILSGNAYYRHIDTKTYNADLNDSSLPDSDGATGERVTPSYSAKKSSYGGSATLALAAAQDQYRAAYGDNLYTYAGNKSACDKNIDEHDEPGEKCSGIINRSNNKQNNVGLQLQLSQNNKLFGKDNTYTVGGGADFSRSHFTQTAEYGYPDSPYMGATVIGSGSFADQNITYGNVNKVLDDRSVDLKSKTRTYSLFATDTLSVTDTVHLSTSGRYNHTSLENRDQQTHYTFSTLQKLPNVLDNDASLSSDNVYARFNPAIGLNFSPSKAFTTYAGYNEGSRAPTSIELGCANPARPCNLPNAMASDPPLKQVVAKTFEAGLRGNVNNVSYSLGLFNTRNANDILFVASTASGAGYFKNFGETQRRGVETSLGTQFGSLSVGGNYTYLDATYESEETVNGAANSEADANGNITIKKGNHLVLTPKNNLKLFASYRFNDQINVGFDTQTRSSSYLRGNENNAHEGQGKSSGYTVLNLSASYVPKSDWTIFGKVNNVFDRDYSTGGALGISPYNDAGQYELSEYSSCSTSGTCSAYGKNVGHSASFLAPGAPRTAFVGVRWEFGGVKKSSASD